LLLVFFEFKEFFQSFDDFLDLFRGVLRSRAEVNYT